MGSIQLFLRLPGIECHLIRLHEQTTATDSYPAFVRCDRGTNFQEGFRTDILRGEDGSLALALKKYGKLRFVTARKARVLTGYGTISADGSLFSSFKKRAIKGLRSFTALFYSKNNYEDEDSNLIK